MVTSAERPLQGAKCLERPLEPGRIESSQHFPRDGAALRELSYRRLTCRPPALVGFFPFKKVCAMPLSALLWRGEDSGGNVFVCSTAPPYNPPRFHPNQHTRTGRSRGPPSGEGSETERGTPVLPETFRVSEELGLPLNSGAFPGSQQAPCGSQAAAKRCLHAANSTCDAVSWQRPAASIHRRARPGALHRTHLGRTRLSYTRAKRRER